MIDSGALRAFGRDHPYEKWMEDNWSALSAMTLLQVTLPGSHNSGNTIEELGTDGSPKCESDNTYTNYLSHRTATTAALSADAFDAAFLPWNVNHGMSIGSQLSEGVRWFHLKACWIESRTSTTIMALNDVYHQHRGFTAQSLEYIISEMIDFLEDNPKEFIVIGMNNLNNFASADKATLATLMVAAFNTAGYTTVGQPGSATTADITMNMASLQALQARVCIFFDGSQDLPATVMPSKTSLYENWDDAVRFDVDLRPFFDCFATDLGIL